MFYKLKKLKRKWKKKLKNAIIRNRYERRRKKYCYEGGMKHKFGPRYATRQIPLEYMKINGFFTAKELNEFLSRSTYIFDICEYCGEKILK